MSLQWINAIASVGAAIFWMISALVPISDLMNTTLGGKGSITHIMRRQSRFSAVAALCAAVSAGITAYGLIGCHACG